MIGDHGKPNKNTLSGRRAQSGGPSSPQQLPWLWYAWHPALLVQSTRIVWSPTHVSVCTVPDMCSVNIPSCSTCPVANSAPQMTMRSLFFLSLSPSSPSLLPPCLSLPPPSLPLPPSLPPLVLVVDPILL